MDLRTSALLVVDLQNDTVGEQGAFAADGAAEFAGRNGVLEQARRLVDAARVEAATISDEWQQAAFSYALTRIAELRTFDDLVAEFAP